MDENDKLNDRGWQAGTFNEFLERPPKGGPKQADYLGGAEFDALLDNLMFNRVIRLRDLREKPQGNDPGKIYWDGANKKYKMWVDETGKWVDIIYTSTSTSTSTTSSSSTSTSSTSSSTSTTSSSTSSTSTSTS